MKTIEVKNISKEYFIKNKANKNIALRDKVFQLIDFKKGKKNKFFALKNISVKLENGEVLGVIGPNGSGKSTFLKILSKVSLPSFGEVIMKGRVGSLLEVGTGFHPELTGRENIFLNGSILGMKRYEIIKKFDSIVEFSGIGKFLDVPVKRYSSGMYVRLAFSVFAYLEPEILLLDEVLSVGDAEFRDKCFGKINEIARTSGRTIVFISHNMNAIQNICHRCLYLDQGVGIALGDPSFVVDKYLQKYRQFKPIYEYPKDPNKKVQIKKIEILNNDNKATINIESEKSFFIKVFYSLEESLHDANLVGIKLSNNNGILLSSYDIDSNNNYYNQREKGDYVSIFELPAGLFNAQKLELTVTCGVSRKNFKKNVNKFNDIKEGIGINIVSKDNFSSKFFSGKRKGHLLMKVPSKIIKL